MDSLNPDFLDPCIAEVKTPLMIALWSKLKPRNSPDLRLAQKLCNYWENLEVEIAIFSKSRSSWKRKRIPEHGLRMILTFKPETSFLVPFDRCIALMRGILESPRVLPAIASSSMNSSSVEALNEHRKQALAFCVCLASVINVSSEYSERVGFDKEGYKDDDAMNVGGDSDEDIEKTIRAAVEAAVLSLVDKVS